jgi:chemotaxis response regulator CheB
MDVLSSECRRNIVVIGASAGGIDALRALFARLPADASASYFVVQHLSAQFPSQLSNPQEIIVNLWRTAEDAMQGARHDAVRALLVVGNVAARL